MSSSWLGKILPSVGRSSTKKTEVPEGLWKKCAKCGAFLYRPELEKNQDVCPKCDHHMRINARRRLDLFLDAEGREELAAELGERAHVLPCNLSDLEAVEALPKQAAEAMGAVDGWTSNGLHSPQQVGAKRIGDCWRFVEWTGRTWKALEGQKYQCRGTTR